MCPCVCVFVSIHRRIHIDVRCSPTARPWSISLPLDADRGEEANTDEVPGHGSEGPEEVLSQVGLLQREVLIGLQASGDLRKGIGVTLVKRLLPKVLILRRNTGGSSRHRKWNQTGNQGWGTTGSRIQWTNGELGRVTDAA